MKYITLDGYQNGTGIRDTYSNEYLNPFELNVSVQLQERINNWATKYIKNKFEGLADVQDSIFETLDKEAIEISNEILHETNEYKIDYYYSDFQGKRIYFKW